MKPCEKIRGSVDIRPLKEWITSIPFEDWPQQAPHDGQLRPAMVNDPNWHYFGRISSCFLLDTRSFDSFLGGPNEWQARMLSAVMPGQFIATHTDPQPSDWLFRIHVPIITNPSTFMIMDKAYYLEPGFAYKIDTTHKHAIINHGDTPRIHFMFDVVKKPPF